MKKCVFVPMVFIIQLLTLISAGEFSRWSSAPIGALYAAGGDDNEKSKKKSVNSDYAKAVKSIKAKKFEEALKHLRAAERTEPDNADVHNYLGYALRNVSRHDEAMKHYRKALTIDPAHLGANEYIGELYLTLGKPEKAEEHLKILDEECFFGCEEYDELKEAIEQYRAKQ